MSMEISSGVTSQVMDMKTPAPGVTREEEAKSGYKNVDEYSKQLQDKYDYMNAGTVSMKGVPTTVSVSSAFLKKCMDDPEKSSILEEKMKAIPKCNGIALSRCQGTLTNINYKIDDNGNMTMIISGSSDPDGKIARENAKRKAEEEKAAKDKAEKKLAEKKAEQERIEKRRAEEAEVEGEIDEFTFSVVGTDVSSITAKLTEGLSSGGIGGTIGFDVKA